MEPKPVQSQRRPEPESSAGVPRGALLGLAALLAVSAVVAFLLLGDGGDATEDQASDASGLAVPWIDPNGQDPVVGALDVNPGRRLDLDVDQHWPVQDRRRRRAAGAGHGRAGDR
jgi:hypothetical protein